MKKLISIALSLALALSLLPTIALAAGETTLTIGGVAMADGAYALTDVGGAVTTDGASAEHYNIKVSITDGAATVTLKDAKIANSAQDAIQATGYDLNLVLEGTQNQIGTAAEPSSRDAIRTDTPKSLTITGAGNLTMVGGYGVEAYSSSLVSIDIAGNLNITSYYGSIQTGSKASVRSAGGDIRIITKYERVFDGCPDVTVAAPAGAVTMSA